MSPLSTCVITFIPCIDVLVASVTLTVWGWGIPGRSGGAPYPLMWSSIMDLLLGLDWNGMPCVMVLKAVSGCLGCMGDVLVCSMVVSLLLHSMGVSLNCRGLVRWLPGSVLLGLDLTAGASLAPRGSSSLSRVGAFSETKL